MNDLVFDYLLTNGHSSVAIALKNDIAKTKFTNTNEIKESEETTIREQVRPSIFSLYAWEQRFRPIYPKPIFRRLYLDFIKNNPARLARSYTPFQREGKTEETKWREATWDPIGKFSRNKWSTSFARHDYHKFTYASSDTRSYTVRKNKRSRKSYQLSISRTVGWQSPTSLLSSTTAFNWIGAREKDWRSGEFCSRRYCRKGMAPVTKSFHCSHFVLALLSKISISYFLWCERYLIRSY